MFTGKCPCFLQKSLNVSIFLLTAELAEDLYESRLHLSLAEGFFVGVIQVVFVFVGKSLFLDNQLGLVFGEDGETLVHLAIFLQLLSYEVVAFEFDFPLSGKVVEVQNPLQVVVVRSREFFFLSFGRLFSGRLSLLQLGVNHEVVDDYLGLGKGTLQSELSIWSGNLEGVLLRSRFLILGSLLLGFEFVEQLLVEVLGENEEDHGVVFILGLRLNTLLLVREIRKVSLAGLLSPRVILPPLGVVVLREQKVVRLFESHIKVLLLQGLLQSLLLA